jgi:hypothetical protein
MKTILLFLALGLCVIGMTGCCSPCNRCWSGCDSACSVESAAPAGEFVPGPTAPVMPMR